MTGQEATDLLRKLGHTQETAAALLGVDRKTIARWMYSDTVPKRAEVQLRRLRKGGHREADYDLAPLLPMVRRLLAMDDRELEGGLT